MNKKQIIIICVLLVLSAAAVVFFVHVQSQREPAIIKTNTGKDIIITLESNRTTGYEWQLAQPLPSDILVFVSSEYIPSQTDLLGAAGKERWTFKAVKAGKTIVSFKYVRPWEKGVASAMQKAFVIVIKK